MIHAGQVDTHRDLRSEPADHEEFYSGVFGLHAISERNPDGFLTDGYINFAFNYRKPGYQSGLDHFGCEVDDVEEVRRRISEMYPSGHLTTRPKLAEAANAYGETVSEPDEVGPALRRALKQVREGVPAVVAVMLPPHPRRDGHRR